MTCADIHSAGSHMVERKVRDNTRFRLLPQKFWTEVERYVWSNCGSSSNPNRARASLSHGCKQWLVRVYDFQCAAHVEAVTDQHFLWVYVVSILVNRPKQGKKNNLYSIIPNRCVSILCDSGIWVFSLYHALLEVGFGYCGQLDLMDMGSLYFEGWVCASFFFVFGFLGWVRGPLVPVINQFW
ncbi:hypothetical protein RHMOL_Rhmol02G0108800 [Rhododendron molle]|uniref:Uncharacterized protein n=1 Tax=Rhododendron molle TaxID=49168 RepID=A0ACC0PNV3_RHOML|nr:hypothetical protein RHMOL_Rhmol02G0108800 [Rhododendron molle]